MRPPSGHRRGFQLTRTIRLSLLLPFGILSVVSAARAQSGANSNPAYQALRNLTLGNEAVDVSNLDLKRDAATFHLRSGTVCFVAPVQDKITGAVFTGDGTLVLSPPASEQGMLKLLTKENEFSENFTQLVLRFTDSTYEEIKKSGAAPTTPCDPSLLKESQHTTRTRLRENLEERILQDVLSDNPSGLFEAFVHGKRYSDKELLAIEPFSGVDQIKFITYDDNKSGRWASFPLSIPPKKGASGMPIRIEHQEIDTTIEGNGNLSGKTTTAFVSRHNGLRVVPLDLLPTLRVEGVTAEGQPLSFIQEDKNEDAGFAVILSKPLAAGDTYKVTTTYSGKGAVSNEGSGNYYPMSRENWFPNNPQAFGGEFTTYDLTFRIPKGMKMAATGELVSESNDGNQNVTIWRSEGPQTEAGFSFGTFKVEEAKLTQPEYDIQSLANRESPDWVKQIQQLPQAHFMGTMDTTSLNKKALAEGEIAVQVYNEYFGPSLFKHLEITQQTACNYGQSWPGLVWIPTCYYFDNTVRHVLGIQEGDRGYWRVVTPHEVAHQWWGHTVAFNSYRDEWMSEGFADASAAIYMEAIEKDPQKVLTFWNDERELLLQRNVEGVRAIDAGSLTMGYRTSNSRTGFDVTRRLIYPKGAYVLHMIRMMLRNNRTGDDDFKNLMHDFVKTYSGRIATTEDFKTIVERHMTREMDLDGNHKMDWFFNEYVYGTQLPSYKTESTFDTDSNGDAVMNLKVTQSGVDGNFKMAVPVYIEGADGKVFFLGRIKVSGNQPVTLRLSLPGLKTKPKRALVNYYDDVLCSPS
jgi:peptidase M1-like protein